MTWRATPFTDPDAFDDERRLFAKEVGDLAEWKLLAMQPSPSDQSLQSSKAAVCFPSGQWVNLALQFVGSNFETVEEGDFLNWGHPERGPSRNSLLSNRFRATNAV